MIGYHPQTASTLAKTRQSKQEAFDGLADCFDYALPQGWLDSFSEWCKFHRPSVSYDMIRSCTVWGHGRERGPITCCSDVLDAWNAWNRSC